MIKTQKTKIPKLYIDKKYNLLYLIKAHPVYKNWKVKDVIKNILDRLESNGFDQLTERTLTHYVYAKRDEKSNQDIKYSYLYQLAIILDCTIDDIIKPIHSFYDID